MSEIIMKICNIGKKYKLKSNNNNHDTFMAVLFDSLRGKLIQRKSSYLESNEFWALKDINFNVNKGDRIGIIGHNGAGKSTLLKLFSRITIPTEGNIEVKGKIAALLEVGTGFHQELTGRENIYLNGAILGMKRNEIEAKFDEIVRFSEVGSFLDVPVKRYSSGMYVKLAFAVAAHLDPDILIVDEVLAVGDMKFQQKCLGKMEQVSGEGRTVLYVSHNMNTVQQLCNRVIVLDHGKIIYDGNVDDGIKVYMDNNGEMNTYIDFHDQKREKHVNKNATMLNSQIVNKKDCLFEQNERLTFSLEWIAHKPLQEIRLRIEILYADNTPAGMTFSLPFNRSRQCEALSDTFELDISSLAPGKYTAVFVLYQINEFGVYLDIDRVANALNFEIVRTSNDTNNIVWTHRWWGHVKFPLLKICEENNRLIG